MLFEVNIDIDQTLTIASLAHQFFINEGCYKGAYELSGTPQMFIQKTVVRGRIMCNSNKKLKFDKHEHKRMNDFDAASLYPSAMARMPGFLKGSPKVIKNLNFEEKVFIDNFHSRVTIMKMGYDHLQMT